MAAFVAQKFAPVTYAPELEQDHGLRPQYILLFDHESLRNIIELLELQVRASVSKSLCTKSGIIFNKTASRRVGDSFSV